MVSGLMRKWLSMLFAMKTSNTWGIWSFEMRKTLNELQIRGEFLKRVVVEMTEPSMPECGIFMCHQGVMTLEYLKKMRLGLVHGTVRAFKRI
jgi:hypothetical protein